MGKNRIRWVFLLLKEVKL